MKRVFLCLLVTLASACSDDTAGPSPDGMIVHIYGGTGAADPFTGVSWIRLVMTGDGLASPLATTAPYAPGGGASLDTVPFSAPGQRRQLVVEGWSDAGGQPGFPISRGRGKPLEVREDSQAAELDILLGRINTFLPLISSDTRAPQSLAQGRIGHAVAMTPKEIVVTGGGTVAQASAAWWTGTGIAQVQSTIEAVDLETMSVASRTAMKFPRVWHSATSLLSNQVILCGGYGADGNPTASCELYSAPGIFDGDPALELVPLAVPRAAHTATMIDETSRLMLFVGGDQNGSWELWDPINGSQGAQPLPDSLPRRHATATTFFIPGRSEPAVLIAGGETTTTVHSTAMLYDSVAKAIIPVSEAMPGGARTQHTAVWVPGRQFIYLAGGFTNVQRSAATSAIDVFNAAESPPRFIVGQAGFRMRTARGGHDATLLSDNVVVMVGGAGDEPAGTGVRPLGSLEIVHEYIDGVENTLHIEVASSWDPAGVGKLPYLPTDRLGHRVVGMENGMALVIGGAAIDTASGGFRMVKELSLYNPK